MSWPLFLVVSSQHRTGIIQGGITYTQLNKYWNKKTIPIVSKKVGRFRTGGSCNLVRVVTSVNIQSHLQWFLNYCLLWISGPKSFDKERICNVPLKKSFCSIDYYLEFFSYIFEHVVSCNFTFFGNFFFIIFIFTSRS